MRVAVLSDVHGNVRALEAVLADASGADLIVANGDLLSYGPRPAETLDLLRSLPNARFVSGNNDRNLVERRWNACPRDGWEAESFANLRWTAEAIGLAGVEFLAGWPFDVRLDLVEPVRVFHASPIGDSVGMFPWTPTALLAGMVSGIAESVIMCGHTHLQMDRRVGPRRVISEGSAGFPFDGDRRPGYALLDDSSGRLSVSFRRVAYDVEAVIADVEAQRPPFGQVIAYQLRHAALMPKHETDYLRADLLRQAE